MVLADALTNLFAQGLFSDDITWSKLQTVANSLNTPVNWGPSSVSGRHVQRNLLSSVMAFALLQFTVGM